MSDGVGEGMDNRRCLTNPPPSSSFYIFRKTNVWHITHNECLLRFSLVPIWVGHIRYEATSLWHALALSGYAKYTMWYVIHAAYQFSEILQRQMYIYRPHSIYSNIRKCPPTSSYCLICSVIYGVTENLGAPTYVVNIRKKTFSFGTYVTNCRERQRQSYKKYAGTGRSEKPWAGNDT